MQTGKHGRPYVGHIHPVAVRKADLLEERIPGLTLREGCQPNIWQEKAREINVAHIRPVEDSLPGLPAAEDSLPADSLLAVAEDIRPLSEKGHEHISVRVFDVP